MAVQARLISVTGADRPGIAARLASVLAKHQVVVRDIEQSTNGGNLSLSFRVDLPGDGQDRPIMKDILFAAWELEVEVEFKEVQALPLLPTRGGHFALTILGAPVTPGAVSTLAKVLAHHRVNIDRITRLSEGDELSCLEMTLSSEHVTSVSEIKQILLPVGAEHGMDLALQREGLVRRVKRLVVFDMDSTLVQGEIIDELARAKGCVDAVSGITARAMAGELDFSESLKERVSLLKGLPVETLAAVHEAMPLNPGARELVTVLKRLGYRLAVISGGFTFFTDRLKAELGLDFAYANTLHVKDGALTGQVVGPVVDGQRKSDLLVALAQAEGIGLEQVIAIGDGANDLLMLEQAGLGVAFNAKQTVQAQADHVINRPRLDSILYLLGIRAAEAAELLETS